MQRGKDASTFIFVSILLFDTWCCLSLTILIFHEKFYFRLLDRYYDLVDDILNTMDNKRADVKEPVKPVAAVAGEGIRSLETSGVFRTLNFELYTRPNKWVMAFGLTAITGCLGYLAWMKAQHRDQA